jgi:branched-chain amino acid transport system ATP-binding protein
MTEPLLRLANLEAGYGAVPVLFDVVLEVRSGEIVTLVGSNGAGKTTLLRAVSRVIPSRGTICFAGSEIASLTPEQVFYRGLVQVPEGRQLFGRMTVEENLLMGAQRQRDRFAIRRGFERVYQLFPILKDRRRQLAGNMSGGEQQMCALARALMAAPRLLAVDEMSLGLAPVIVDQLLEILVEIRKQGVTVLLVEQDVFAAFSVADRGYVMETGRIVRTGPVSELAKDESVRRAYLGEMSAEALDGRPIPVRPDDCGAAFPGAGIPV